MNYTRRRSRRRRAISEINVVPYIDVTFVLLIIFMMTAPLQKSAVDVDLPIAAGAKIEPTPEAPVMISIEKNGQFYLSEKEGEETALALSALLSRIAFLQKNNPQVQIYIKADKAIDYGKVVSVMAALKEVGVSHVGLMTSSIDL